MDLSKRRRIALAVLASTLAIATAAIVAWLGMRWILRQDVRDSAQAQRVIAASQLRAQGERFVGRARAFLLTGDDHVLERLRADQAAFLAALDRLVPRHGRSRTGAVAALRVAAGEYAAVLDEVIAGRRSAPTHEVVVSYEERLRSLRARLDTAFDDLLEREEAHLRSVEGSSRKLASSITAVSSAVALGALVIAAALGIWLARAFESLARKHAELVEAKARLEAANGDLEAFAGRVAHDLRTPLTPISLLATQIQRSSQDPRVVSAANRIAGCVQRASGMVEGLLTFSRIGGGITGAATTPAATSVAETLDDFADAIQRDGIVLETELDPAATVACGPALFREIVANLVGNALKFLKDRETRRLSVRVHGGSDAVELEVADTGPGIPPEALPRIFDPFYRVSGAAAPGSGIGLATVRRIVDAHHGSVAVRSQLGAGATFCVRLPRGASSGLMAS